MILAEKEREKKHTYILHIGKLGLLCRVLTQHLVRLEIHIDPRVSQSHQDVVQPHKQPAQQQHALLVDPQLGAVQRDAVVVQLALVQDDLVEEEDRIAALQQLNGDLLVRRPEAQLRGRRRRLDGAAVRRRVAPVVGLDDLLDVLRRLLARALPVARVRHAQHVLVRLVDGVERVRRVELQRPVGGRVRDGHEVVAEDHLRHGDAELLLERIDGRRLGDGELAGRDAEMPLRVGGCGGGEGVGGWEGLVGGGDVIHFVD